MKYFLLFILTAFTILTGCSKKLTKSKDKVSLVSWNASNCESNVNPGEIVTRIGNFHLSNDTLKLTIHFSDNCCPEFNPSVSFRNDTLFILPYEEKFRIGCDCDCCFSIDFIIAGVKHPNFVTLYKGNPIQIEKPNLAKETVIDSIYLNLDEDDLLEEIVISEGYYEMNQYKFDVYKNQKNIGTLYSQFKYPWLESLEKEPNNCGILWVSNYLNGSDCGGDAYYGYVLIENELKHVISIPDTYYGCYSIGAPKGDPFCWGNILLTKVKYNCKTSLEITIDLDLHKSPSWEQMDSINQVRYDERHKLNFSWMADQEKYLVKSKVKKDTAYSIETVYDMTEYLGNEYGLKWP